MAEKEQHERIARENKIIDIERELQIKELNNFKRGQIFAITAVVLVIGLCAYGFYLGKAKEAQNIAIWVIASIATVFITGRFILISSQKKIEKQ